MSKKRPKFKKRHKFSLSESMPKERRIRDNLLIGIWQAFPDPKKKLEYMKGLLAGLDKKIAIYERKCVLWQNLQKVN